MAIGLTFKATKGTGDEVAYFPFLVAYTDFLWEGRGGEGETYGSGGAAVVDISVKVGELPAVNYVLVPHFRNYCVGRHICKVGVANHAFAGVSSLRNSYLNGDGPNELEGVDRFGGLSVKYCDSEVARAKPSAFVKLCEMEG